MQNDEFEKWGKTPPTSEKHGTDEDIRENLVKLLPNNWVLEGNKLSGMTPYGRLTHFIPTGYILTGVKKGLPVLEKVKY